MRAPKEVDCLYDALTTAGAQGELPVDTLMYRPVRTAILTDPFGVSLLVAYWLGE